MVLTIEGRDYIIILESTGSHEGDCIINSIRGKDNTFVFRSPYHPYK